MISKTNKFSLEDPKLTEEQEAAFVEAGTEDALTELVMDKIKPGFVYGRIYCGSRFDDDELLSVVYQAMTAAARRFKPGRQKLTAFAKPFIRGELHRAWKRKAPVGVPLPETVTVKAAQSDDEGSAPVEVDFTNFDYDAVDRSYYQELIRPWLSRLTDHEYLVVDLIFFGGYSQTEVGRLLGTRRQSVNTVLTRVFTKFKGWLA